MLQVFGAAPSRQKFGASVGLLAELLLANDSRADICLVDGASVAGLAICLAVKVSFLKSFS